MRLHPVIPMVVRTLMKPATIGGYDLPAGTTVGPSIIIAHSRPDNHESPSEFRPARFVERQPAPNTWIPFGGGVCRCIDGPGERRVEPRPGHRFGVRESHVAILERVLELAGPVGTQ